MDADFSRLFDGVMQMYPELSNKMDRLGYTKGSFYGDEGEWTKGSHIVALDGGCFSRNARLCIPNDPPVLQHKLLLGYVVVVVE
jgi:hypothetical protein